MKVFLQKVIENYMRRSYMPAESPHYEGGHVELREDQEQQVASDQHPLHGAHHHHANHHHHQHEHQHQHHQHQQQAQREQYGQLGAGEIPVPEGGDSHHRLDEATLPSEGNQVSSHMPHSTMLGYSTGTLSPPTDHHSHHQQQSQQQQQQHHLSDSQHSSLSAQRHLGEGQQQHHQETTERVSGIIAAMRSSRSDFALGQFLPHLASATSTSQSPIDVSVNSHHHHHHHHQQPHSHQHQLDDVLTEDPYLQHQMRTSSAGNGGTSVASGVGDNGGASGPNGGASPPLRTGSSPGSSRSPHDDHSRNLSSPTHRHSGHNDDDYSPNDHGRLHQSFTNLTSMQPPNSVQTPHNLQDTERVNEQLYMESIYAHHSATGTPHHHHHQEHEQPPSPHSPSGALTRLVPHVLHYYFIQFLSFSSVKKITLMQF